MTTESPALRQFDKALETVHHDCVAIQLLEILFESSERYFTSVTSMECRSRFLPKGGNSDLKQPLQLFHGRRKHARAELLKNCHLINQYLLKEFHRGIDIAGVNPAEETTAADYDTGKLDAWVRELLFGVFCQRERLRGSRGEAEVAPPLLRFIFPVLV